MFNFDRLFNQLLNLIIDYLYPYTFDIFSLSKCIFVAVIFSAMYIVSKSAYKSIIKENSPLPLKNSLIIRTIYYGFHVVAAWYVYSFLVTFSIYGLAYLLDRLHVFPIDKFIPCLVVAAGSTVITLIIEAFVLNRLIQQKIINPLNQISNAYAYKKSGKKEYNPDKKRTHVGEYNPRKYFKQDKLFFGLNEFKQPVYADLKASLDGHICIAGGSGSGKGVETRILLSQFIQYGLCNIIFDVKPDKYLFNLCSEECRRANKKMYVIDIDVREPQIQLFGGINQLDFETIVKSAMELEPQKQTNARVYAQNTEKALERIADKIYQKGMTPKEIINACYQYDTDLLDQNTDLEALLRNLSRYKIFNSREAPTIQEILEENAVFYIRAVSAKENMASSLILRLLFQTITKETQYNDRYSCIFLDEFKFIMTTSVINQLATIRDFNTTLMFNFQSFTNFETSPNAAMNKKAYGRELLDNSHIFALGNSSDIETIEIVQKKGGQTTYDRAFELEEGSLGGASITSADRRYTKHVDYKLTQSEISNGAKNTMILLAPALFKDREYEQISTHYIATNNYNFAISETYKETFVENIAINEPKIQEKQENENIEVSKKDLFGDED